MKKIGIICPYNIYRPGGVQEIVLAQYRYFKSKGYESRIIAPRPIRDKYSLEKLHDIDEKDIIQIGKSLEYNTPFKTIADLGYSLDSLKVKKMLENENFDILHFHEPWIPSLGLQVLKYSTSKNFATFHAKLPFDSFEKYIKPILRAYTSSFFTNFEKIYAVSSQAAQLISKVAEIDPIIVPNSIDLSEYYKDTQRNEFGIAYLGRLEKRKGLVYLIKAMKIVAKEIPEVKLFIAGDGGLKNLLQALVLDYKLQDNVEFLGQLSHEDKLEFLAQNKLFCSPAIYGESFGIVLLEAMASGNMVVAGNNPGYSELMQGAGRHAVVNPKDPKSLAYTLLTFMQNDELYKTQMDWQNDYIVNFDHSTVFGILLEDYKNAI